MRHGPTSEMRRRASADATAPGLPNRGVRRIRSWRRPLHGDGAQMVVTGGKWCDFTSGLLRRDPDSLVAPPAARQHVLGKTREQVGGQRRLFQREGMVAPRDDHE